MILEAILANSKSDDFSSKITFEGMDAISKEFDECTSVCIRHSYGDRVVRSLIK
ncbi:hypothetical protein [Sinanaerobacter chloroacetimidivorans]|jgi:hypothetical protein|uniref:hypothetical protein n=1 Tax=Sinanaerobacter chloroacetimidivorans TaxID=2818044 RepID=UPI001D038CAC|nr:hypothetical protein [Sinanaerobacter chloroacetimidivorans]